MYSIITFAFLFALFAAGYFINGTRRFTGITSKNIDKSAIEVWKRGIKVKNYAWLALMIIISVSIISLVTLNSIWFENQANDLIEIIDLKLNLIKDKHNFPDVDIDEAGTLNKINFLETKIYRRENSHWPIYVCPYEKSFHQKNPISISTENK